MKIKVTVFTISIVIISSIEGSAIEKLKDVKPPIFLPVNYWPVIIIAIITAICIFVLYLRKLFKEDKKIKRKDIRLPYEIALERLDRLVKRKYVLRERLKIFYSELSEILRVYIEGQYKIKALDLTTEEFLNEIKEFEKLTSEQRDMLKNFLNKSDLVKFAKYGPTNQENEDAIMIIRQFINETKQMNLELNKVKYGI